MGMPQIQGSPFLGQQKNMAFLQVSFTWLKMFASLYDNSQLSHIMNCSIPLPILDKALGLTINIIQSESSQ